MRRKYLFGVISLVALTLTLPQPAWANDPPGPSEAIPMVLMLPLMALFTAIGGGYAIMKVRVKKPGLLSRIIKVVLLVFLFFFGLAFQGMASAVMVILAIFAVQRGVQMVSWGVKPQQGPGESVPGPGPRRLIAAGVGLIAAVVYLAGIPLALGLNPERQNSYRWRSVREFVAYQLAYAQFEKALSGNEAFNRFPKGDPDIDFYNWRWGGGRPGFRSDFAPDGKRFTFYAFPLHGSPLWPYRWLSTANSYRGDETGQIRMARVTEPNTLCPPNAPVVAKVEDSDVREWLERARMIHGFEFSEDLAPIQLQGKWGYVDKSGKIVIQPQFESAASFSDGRAQTTLHARPVVIDRSGKVIPSQPAK